MKRTHSLLLAALAAAPVVNAQTVRTWDGEGGDGLWATAANWSNNTVPIANNTAAFTVPGLTGARLNGQSNFDGNLVFGNGGSFTIGGLTAAPDNASIILSSSTVGRTVSVLDSGTYTIALSSDSTANVSNGTNGRLRWASGSPAFDIAAGGTLVLGGRYSSNSGATPTLVKSGPGTLRFDPTTVNSGMNAQVNLTGGTLLLNGGANNVLTGVSGIAAGATVRLLSGGNNLASGTTTFPALSGVRGIAGTFDLNGFSIATTRLEGSDPAGAVTNGGGSDAVLTVGNYGTATGLAADLTAATFAGTIGDGPSNKTGLTVTSGTTAYTLNLTGANTYSGATIVNGGVLALQGGTIANSSSLTLSGSGKLRVGNGGTLYQNLALPSLDQGAGTAVELDLGGASNDRLTIAGAYTAGGSVDVKVLGSPTAPSYTLVSSASRTGTPAVNVSGLAGSRVTHSVATTATEVKISFSGGAASLVWMGNDPVNPNTWDLAVTDNFLNGAVPDSFHSLDTVTFDDNAFSFTPNIAVPVSPAAVVFNHSFSDYTLGGSGLAAGSLTKRGIGYLTITGAHTFGGGTTLNEGRLRIGNAAALGTGPVNLLGGELTSASTAAYTLANPVTLNGSVIVGDPTTTGALTFGGPVTLAGNSTIDTPGPFTVTHNVTGAIGDGGASFKLTKQGPGGVLALNAANSYDGGTDILGGRINVNHLSAFGSGPVNVDWSGQAYLIVAGTHTQAFTIAGIGPVEAAGQLGAIRLNANTLSGNILLNDRARITAYNSSGTLGGNIGETLPGMLLELGGSGLGASGGTITVSGNNTHTGGTEIRGAIVKIASNSALGSGDAILNQGAQASYQTRLDLGPNVAIGNRLILDSNAQTGTLAEVYSDAGDATTPSLAVVGGPVEILQVPGDGGHFGARANSNSVLRVTGAIDAPTFQPLVIRPGTVELGGGGTYDALSHAAGTLRLSAHQGISRDAVVTLGNSATANESSLLDLNGFNQTLAGLARGAQGATVLNNGANPSTLTIDSGSDSNYGGAFGAGTGAMSLVKSGAGTFTLSGASNSFAGALSVNGGTLNLTGSFGAAASAVACANGTILNGEGSIGGKLTLGSMTMEVDGGTDAAQQLAVGGDLTVNGTVTVKLLSLPAAGGAVEVIAYNGAFGGAGSFVLHEGAKYRSPVFDTSGGVVDLNFGTPLDLVWTGAGGSAWDVNGTANWRSGATASKFLYIDNATFDDSVASDQTVQLAGSLLAGNVTFRNSLRRYTLADGGDGALRAITLTKLGSGTATIETGLDVSGTIYIDDGILRFQPAEGVTQTIGGLIDGLATIAKGGAGRLSITGANPGFRGTLAIASGEVTVGASGGLGSALVSFGDATPQPGDTPKLTLASGVKLTNPVEVEATALDCAIAGAGALDGSATITKKGAGILRVQNANTFTGPVSIVGGVVQLETTGALASGTTVTLGAFDTAAGEDTILRIGPSSASGTVGCAAPVAVSDAAPTGSKAILDNNPLSTAVCVLSGAVTLRPGRPLWIRNSGGQLWQINGKIGGNGDVYIDNGSYGKRIRFNYNGNDFTGNVHFVSGGLQTGNGVPNSTSNAIPDNSDVFMSAGTVLGLGASDTFGALNGGAADPGNGLAAATVKPNISGPGTQSLTLGANGHDGAFDGTMSDEGSDHYLRLTKTGAGSQALNGACTFTGTTTVSGGRLVVNNTYASAVTVAAGATLGGNMASTAAVSASAAGARLAPGVATGTMSAASASLAGGGVLEIGIDDTAAPRNDKLSVSGELNVSGATLQLAVAGPLAQPAYVIASYGTLSGTFGTVNNLPAGYRIVYNHNDGVSSNNIALVGQAADPYLAWLARHPSLAGADRAPTADPDKDGLENGVEFVIGADPAAVTAAGKPAAARVGGDLVFTFRRSDESEGFAVSVEHDTSPQDLTGTPDGSVAVPAGPVTGPPVTVIDNGPATPDDVTVSIPMGADPRKFARLKVVIPYAP